MFYTFPGWLVSSVSIDQGDHFYLVSIYLNYELSFEIILSVDLNIKVHTYLNSILNLITFIYTLI